MTVKRRKPGRKPLTPDEHRRRGTFQPCRHGDVNRSTGDPRPELHSYRGHVRAMADFPQAGRALIYALRDDQTITWDDVPALVARLTKG